MDLSPSRQRLLFGLNNKDCSQSTSVQQRQQLKSKSTNKKNGMNNLLRRLESKFTQYLHNNKKIEILGDRNGAIKNHFSKHHNYNNRSGSFETVDGSLERKCYLPFYKGYIDLTMDMRFCCNDWKYKESLGNINDSSIEELWMSSKMNSYRKHMISL